MPFLSTFVRRLVLCMGFTFCAVGASADSAKIYTTYKLDKAAREALVVELRMITGENELPEIAVDQILKHAMTSKVGSWYVLYNPAHELFVFVKENGPGTAATIHAATIAMVERDLNPSNTIRHEDDRLVREFKEARDFLKFWKYITDQPKYANFFEVAFQVWPKDAYARRIENAAVIYAPLARLADKSLLSCFSFLEGDAWKSRPELANLAKLDDKLLKQLTPLDFYIQDKDNLAILLGDTVLAHLFVAISVSRTSTCQPKQVQFLGLGE